MTFLRKQNAGNQSLKVTKYDFPITDWTYLTAANQIKKKNNKFLKAPLFQMDQIMDTFWCGFYLFTLGNS